MEKNDIRTLPGRDQDIHKMLNNPKITRRDFMGYVGAYQFIRKTLQPGFLNEKEAGLEVKTTIIPGKGGKSHEVREVCWK